jgi:hypothetical protein
MQSAFQSAGAPTELAPHAPNVGAGRRNDRPVAFSSVHGVHGLRFDKLAVARFAREVHRGNYRSDRRSDAGGSDR